MCPDRHADAILLFVDDPLVKPTDNHDEQALGPERPEHPSRFTGGTHGEPCGRPPGGYATDCLNQPGTATRRGGATVVRPMKPLRRSSRRGEMACGSFAIIIILTYTVNW